MSGFAMARAALTAAGYNVRINVNDLQNRTAGEGLVAELGKVERRRKRQGVRQEFV